MSEAGAIFYRGPSLLTGEPILGVLTGLDHGSQNPKTGSIVQSWILRPDLPPMEAVRRNLDGAICGDCKLRGEHGHGRRCYVVPWFAPMNVYRSIASYIDADWPTVQALVEGRTIRLGAYGDPAALPFDVWRMLLVTARSWIGYTHQWRRCDPRFKTIAMASVDSLDELRQAQAAGWRTFRVRLGNESLPTGNNLLPECICPASDEGGHRTTCARCRLCRGTSTLARSIVIVAHGNNSAMTAFHKSRAAAERQRSA